MGTFYLHVYDVIGSGDFISSVVAGVAETVQVPVIPLHGANPKCVYRLQIICK